MSDDIMYIVINYRKGRKRIIMEKSCPVCEERIDYAAEKIKYCPFCGQRLQYIPCEKENCAVCGIKRINTYDFCPKCGQKYK